MRRSPTKISLHSMVGTMLICKFIQKNLIADELVGIVQVVSEPVVVGSCRRTQECVVFIIDLLVSVVIFVD